MAKQQPKPQTIHHSTLPTFHHPPKRERWLRYHTLRMLGYSVADARAFRDLHTPRYNDLVDKGPVTNNGGQKPP